MDPVALAGIDDRAQRDLFGRWIADRQPVGLGGQPFHVLRVDRIVHQVPADGHAGLALVEERTEGGCADGLLEIGVVQHDQRGVPAQLQVGPLEVAAGQLADSPAGRGRAGERDDPDVRILDQHGTDVRATGQHVQDTWGQPGFLEHARQHDPAADRRTGVRLEHHCIAQCKSRRHRPHRQRQRAVERRDDADHPDRHPAHDAQPGWLAGQQLALRSGRQPGGLVALLSGRGQLEVGLARDAAGLPDQPAGQFVRIPLQRLARAPQHRGSLMERRPHLLRGAKTLTLGAGPTRYCRTPFSRRGSLWRSRFIGFASSRRVHPVSGLRTMRIRGFELRLTRITDVGSPDRNYADKGCHE